MKYFKQSEFKMGKENVFNKMDANFLIRLDHLRENAKIPLKINSSFRSPDYNEKIGGAKFSQHLLGKAVDIHCVDSSMRAKLIEHALLLGFTIGVAKSFIHIDTRENKIAFTY